MDEGLPVEICGFMLCEAKGKDGVGEERGVEIGEWGQGSWGVQGGDS